MSSSFFPTEIYGEETRRGRAHAHTLRDAHNRDKIIKESTAVCPSDWRLMERLPSPSSEGAMYELEAILSSCSFPVGPGPCRCHLCSKITVGSFS